MIFTISVKPQDIEALKILNALKAEADRSCDSFSGLVIKALKRDFADEE